MLQISGLVPVVYRYQKDHVAPALRRAVKGIPDARNPKGKRWQMGDIFANGVWDKLSEMRTGRELETLTGLAHHNEEVGTLGGQSMSDSTAHAVLEVTGEDAVRHVMTNLGRDFYRTATSSST